MGITKGGSMEYISDTASSLQVIDVRFGVRYTRGRVTSFL